MPSRHPNRGTLERLASGQLEGKPLVELLQHLCRCSRCRSLADRAILASSPRTSHHGRSSEGYRAAFLRASVQAGDRFREFCTTRRKAGEEIAYFQALPDPQRRRFLRALPRLRSYSWIRELLNRSRDHWFDDPTLAEKLTELALFVSDHLESREYGRRLLEDLRAEIWAYLANARRIRSDHRGAVDAFARAEEHRRKGTGDPLEEAQSSVLFASFLREVEALEEASSYIDRALSLYREAGDRHGVARCLLCRANIERSLGDLEGAINLMDQAARGIDPRAEPRLVSLIRRNRALDVSRSATRPTIERALDELVPLRDHGYVDRLRTIWIRGALVEKLGQLGRAERHLEFAREGFARAEIPMDVALLDLDLARIRLLSNRRDEALRSAASAFPVFASRGLQARTLRALDLFRQAGGAA